LQEVGFRRVFGMGGRHYHHGEECLPLCLLELLSGRSSEISEVLELGQHAMDKRNCDRAWGAAE
jgi:hypothetical protein